jgi:hypothetical protein
MSLKYETSLELLHITAKPLFLNLLHPFHQQPDVNYIQVLEKVETVIPEG